jgi:hypothetical protein
MEIDASILASLHLQYPLVRSINANLSLKMIGLSSLNGLSEFVGVKCLDASNNNLDRLEPDHLSFMTDLRILKLQHNKISQLPSFAAHPLLHTLDLSSNMISQLSNLISLPSLHSLHLSNNRLVTADSMSDLSNCHLLETLELNSNLIQDRDVLTLLSTLPALKWLQIRNNPFAATLAPYRKNIVGTISQLVALDGEAVDERERYFASAFVSGGTEAEAKARETYHLKIKERERRNREFLRSQLGSRKIPASPRPASIDHFHGITRRVRASDSEQNCGVCMQVLNDECASLHCTHEFHANCVLQWLSRSLHCPTCRSPVIELDHAASSDAPPPISQSGSGAVCGEDAQEVAARLETERLAAKRLMIEQRVAERRLQMALEKQASQQGAHGATTNPQQNSITAGTFKEQAPSPASSPVLRGKGRGKLLQSSRAAASSEGGPRPSATAAAAATADAAVGSFSGAGAIEVVGSDAVVCDDSGSGVAGLQRAHQADSSRQQRMLAALGKKLAKDEAMLQSNVASMLEKRGEDASSAAVSSEVARRRQAWESELHQFHAERQQVAVSGDVGGSGHCVPVVAAHAVVEACTDAAGEGGDVGEQAPSPASSPVLRGKGRGKLLQSSRAAASSEGGPRPSATAAAVATDASSSTARNHCGTVFLPLFVCVPPPRNASLVQGPSLTAHCVVSVGASRCSSTLSASCIRLQRVCEASVVCLSHSRSSFCVCLRFKRVLGTASLASAGAAATLHIRPFDVLKVSTKNLPCVVRVQCTIDGNDVAASITLKCEGSAAAPV